MTITKLIIILFCVFILFSLGSALYYLITDRGSSSRMAKALTWRISLSLLLFVFLFVAFYMGWITPHRL